MPKRRALKLLKLKNRNDSEQKSKLDSKTKKPSRWQAVPLKGSFMVTAILGIFISIYWIYPMNPNYGVAFMFVFGAMFLASVISMTKAPIMNPEY